MRKLLAILLLAFCCYESIYAAADDTLCYKPDKQAYYIAGEEMWYRNMHTWTTSLGLPKLKFDMQHVKVYLVVNTDGKVVNVLNAGCSLDTNVERILTTAFLKLQGYKAGEKDGRPVLSARLYEFNVYPYMGAHYDVRVKLQETEGTKGKDFNSFISMYNKWIKREAYFPKNYKQDKYDGLVTVEFSFNKHGKPTKFSVIKSDKEEFVQNSFVSLFCVKPIPADYLEMIGPEKRFIATFDYVSFANEDMYGIPSNH